MAEQNPTVIIAHLDDEKLRKSIDSLVGYVDEKFKAMTTSTTNAVNTMQNELQKLGSLNTKSVGGVGGGELGITKALQRAKQEAKDSAVTFDKMSSSIQQAISPKSAQDSYYTIIKNMRENVALLAMEIKSMPSSSLDKQFAVYMQYERQIEQVRARISELNAEMQNLGKDPNSSRLVIKQTMDEIAVQQQKIVQLEREQLQATQQIEVADRQTLANKQQQYEKERKALSELVVGERERVAFQNSSLEKQTSELQKQIGLIQSRGDAKKTFENAAAMPVDTYEQAQEKLRVLESLKEKVANTPLFSKNQTQELGNEIEKVRVRMSFLYKTTEEGVAEEKARVAAQNKLMQDRLVQIEKEKAALKERGLAAQQSANAIREAMRDQLQDNMATGTQQAISGLKDLQQHIRDMQRAFGAMNQEEQESPIGRALKNDIRLAREAMVAVSKYNLSAVTGRQTPIEGLERFDSYKLLSQRVSRLTKEYQDLTAAERDAEKGKGMAEKIQLFSRALQEIQRQMGRPISLEKALGNPENTLDRIAYKIQQLNAYRAGLDITDTKQVGEMRTVENEIDRLKKKQDELMGKNQQLMNSNNALARSWNYMKNRLAFYFTVGASTQFVKNLIEVRSQYEMNERALGILIDSAERGTQIFNELSQMALVSPYTLIELSTAAKQLSAYDVAAKDLVDTTRRLADISAAVGLPVERLTTALGQIKAFEHLTSMTARRFSSAGIPLIKALADHYTELEGRMVSVADVYDRMKKKAISYNDVMAVITEMTDEGGKFFDFQAKMADTLKVQLANLTLAWNNMLNEIGKSEQGVLVGGIKGLKELFLQWKNIEKAALAFGISLGVVKTAQILYLIFGAKINKQLAVQAVLGQKAAHAFDGLGASLMKVATNPWTWVTIGIAMLANLAITAHQADEAIKKLNKSIIDAANERVESINKTIANLNSQYNFEEFAPAEHRLALDTNKDEAKKIWETIREEIELSSSSAQEFINRLENIDDINVRVGKGFDYLKDIQKAQAALSQLDIKDIDVEQDMAGWYNLYALQDGLIENFRDMQKEAGRAEKDWKDYAIRAVQGFHWGGGVLGAIIGGMGIKGNEGEHLKRYQEDLQTTVDSIIASMKKYNVEGANVQREFFATSMDKILQDTDLTEKERLKIRIDAQELFYQSEVKSRQQAIAKETGDYKTALQQELNDFIHFHEQRNGYILGFEQWLQKTQITMLTETFGKMSAKELKQIDFSKGEWSKWAYEISKKFAEQNNLAIDDVFSNLRKYLSQDFVLYIKTVLQKPDDKSVYDTLTEADKAADEAWTKIQRLKTRKGELEAKGAVVAGTREIDTEYANTIQELTEAQEDYNAALAKGGHSKKENTSDTKAQKQAETELQKALKDELSLLDKVRSQYKKLTDAGVDSNQALTIVTNQFTNSIQRINNILGKNGLPLFNIKAFAGTDNPNAVLEMLKKQLDAAKVAKNIKPSEIKELEVKYGEIVIDAKVYNTKKIADGLNNELSKIKDEYELSVELDANPELGGIFMDIFDIDPNNLPNTIDAYATKVMEALNRSFEKQGKGFRLDTLSLTDDDLKAYKAESEKQMGAISEEDYKNIEKYTKEIRNLRKKDREDTLKQTQDLQYKLGDVNEKIAIESKKLTDLQVKYQKETNDEKKRLLSLQIKDQENAIAKLGEEVMQMLPTYKNLFNSIAEHSAVVTRRIAKQWKNALENAVKNPDGTYTITDPKSGEKATLSEKEYGRQLDKVNGKLRETQSSFSKINEAFTKGEDDEIDYAKGIELVAEEAKKAADGLHTVADIVAALGGSEDAVETLNDIATSMEGAATAAQGYAKIQSGDIIGGATDMIKGTWQAVSTWLDNGDKKISRQIAASERQVRKLELAYIDLEHEVEKAYGTAAMSAKRVAIANKELQLVELKRQLALEESRRKKNRDEDRIIELKKQIKELEYDIRNSIEEITNDFLGISSVGDAMENLMGSFIEALRNGENAMDTFDESIDEMIANMVKKMLTTKILQPWFDEQWDKIQQEIDARVGKLPETIATLKGQVSKAKDVKMDNDDSVWLALNAMGLSGSQIHQYETYDENGNLIWSAAKRMERRRKLYEKTLDQKEKELDKAQQEFTAATTPSQDDIKRYAELLRSGQPVMEENMKDVENFLRELGLIKDSKDKTLSNLQQGIQGITEETAGALEAYMNGVSQQVYLQSDLLTQIRDAVVAFDNDVQIATNAQILLQLQQSYAVQMAIQSILVGWSNPSGQAVRVELLS